MEVGKARTMPLELAREPEMVWGLGLSDLPWLFMGGVADGWIWHAVVNWTWRLAAMASAAFVAVGLAWGRWEGERVPIRLWQWLRWRLGPRLFLP